MRLLRAFFRNLAVTSLLFAAWGAFVLGVFLLSSWIGVLPALLAALVLGAAVALTAVEWPYL